MNITGSCGHRLTASDGPDGMGWPIEVAGYSRDYTPAIEYRHVCTKCRDWYEERDLLVKSKEEIDCHLAMRYPPPINTRCFLVKHFEPALDDLDDEQEEFLHKHENVVKLKRVPRNKS